MNKFLSINFLLNELILIFKYKIILQLLFNDVNLNNVYLIYFCRK